MINSLDTQNLPNKDLAVSGLIIFIISNFIAKLYNPIVGFTYAFVNALTLTF